jgi:ferredoxin--NADP+ reductase
LEEGGDILDVAGPLGTASDIKNYGKCIIVAGGVGAAVAYPVLKALKNEGCKITCLVGAKSELFLILTDQIKQLSDQLIITTDDDTKGKKGFVTDALENLLNKDSNFDYVYTAGPLVMMEKVAQITKKYSIKTVASLNNIMVDATGMCGGCRTLVAGQEKLACVDGPEFNAHQVDFKLLKQRKQMFKEQEEQAFKSYREQKQRK